jgi:AcrR family transcriptional regulator
MGRRADQREETRRRIVDAAVELHSTVGPARTTVAQIAERAGVQRHTYYAHFPEERDLFLACSGHALSRDPLPDAAQWRALAPGWERIRRGLEELYRWYERNAEMAACVIRDAEHHALTREMTELRMLPTFAAAHQTLGERMSPRAQALLGVALDFACWRSLHATQDAGNAALLMSDAICALE